MVGLNKQIAFVEAHSNKQGNKADKMLKWIMSKLNNFPKH